MRFEPIVAAALRFGPQGLPFSPEYADVYHPAAGAAGQAQHVFLGGNGLPARWRGREDFVILETGFGLGNNFLATWDAWRQDPQRCGRLHFISVEKHPFTQPDLRAAHESSQWPDLAAELIKAWPPLTPDLHPLNFEGAKLRLLLALGDVQAWLPQLVARVNAFYLDGFAPARNPVMWAPQVCKALARLAEPQATLATWSAARSVREGLRSAGFSVTQASGFGAKRDITLARFDPAFTPRRAVARQPARPDVARHAVIVGAGLAGCATAWALARQGWTTLVLDQHESAAQEASGNPAGTFHGSVNRQDGSHARFNRAAAIEAHRVIEAAIAHGGLLGSAAGLIRLECDFELTSMRAALAQLGLPQDYVRALDAADARTLSGMALTQPAWFFPSGGWVDPGGLARRLLDQTGPMTTLRGGVKVASMRRGRAGWELLDSSGSLLEQASTLVLANAGGAVDLLRRPDWPLRCLRGQISLLPVQALAAASVQPRLALAGAGFLIPAAQGHFTFGATSHADDADPSVRITDHEANLARLAQMGELGWVPSAAALKGRVGWRWSSDDRLPLIGAVPAAAMNPVRLDQPRFVARESGLYVFIGLGSRGITWAALGAQVLACLIGGTPVPLPAALIDAIDPARFVTRKFRKAMRGPSDTRR